ncbi:MAG: RNA 2',3'-cyclic phosphodiesterase [Actinomycetota bacterium]
MTERLFVAVTVPSEVRARLDAALAGLRQRWPSLRWTRPEGWHLTLAFVGDCDEDRAREVSDAAAEAAAAVGPFEVALTGQLGSFGRRVLWAGVAAPEGLVTLAERTRAGLAARGIDVDERPFSAHLTVARAPARGRLPHARPRWQGPRSPWWVTDVRVMRSVPASGGPRYEARSAHPLGAGP